MNNTGFSKGDILVPNVECMSAWSVIACDQYTSQPQYWRDVENFVKTKPSTLNMMVPEIRFASDDLDQRICSVNRAMRTYLRRHMFYEVHDYIYSRRVLSNGKVRCGLVGVIDLEQYEFHPGSQTTVRATEGVIQSLIEPRLAIRDLTPLEVSHTMLLIDDRENTVFASLEQELDQMQLLYSFDLMMGKILGVASVAIVQVLLWGVLIAGVGALVMPHLMPEDVMASAQAMQQGMPDAASMSGMNPEMLQAVAAMTDLGYIVKIFVSLLLFVFGGYLLYSAMFAAVGSAVDNVQDASQLQMPITLPIILALLMMFVVIKDPNSQLAFWFSIIPFTSPIVMMARIPYDIPLWEVALSLVVLYASFVGMVWFAAKIYRVGIFMYGKKPSLKELFKWIRYKY